MTWGDFGADSIAVSGGAYQFREWVFSSYFVGIPELGSWAESFRVFVGHKERTKEMKFQNFLSTREGKNPISLPTVVVENSGLAQVMERSSFNTWAV